MSPIAATAMSVSRMDGRRVRPLAWAGALLAPVVIGPLWMGALATSSSGSPQLLGTLTGFVVVVTAAAAAYTDARWQLIPNWVTYSAALWGVGINVCASWAPESFQNLGGVGLGASLAGLILLFTLFLIVFSFTGGGAGDVKLAGAIGALLGFELGAEALLYAFAAAGIAIAVWAVGSIGPITVVRLLARRFGGQYFPTWISPATEQDRKILSMAIPLGPFFAVGMLIVVTDFNQTIERWLPGG